MALDQSSIFVLSTPIDPTENENDSKTQHDIGHDLDGEKTCGLMSVMNMQRCFPPCCRQIQLIG